MQYCYGHMCINVHVHYTKVYFFCFIHMSLCTFNTYKIYTVDVLIHDFRFYYRSANFFVARTSLEPEITLIILLQEKWTIDEVEKSFISTSEKYIFSFVFYGVSSELFSTIIDGGEQHLCTVRIHGHASAVISLNKLFKWGALCIVTKFIVQILTDLCLCRYLSPVYVQVMF